MDPVDNLAATQGKHNNLGIPSVMMSFSEPEHASGGSDKEEYMHLISFLCHLLERHQYPLFDNK
jgi:hypothetical protein